MSDAKPDMKSLRETALRMITEREKVDGLMIAHSAENVIPSTGKSIFQFIAIKEGDLNGPRYGIALDEDAASVDVEALAEEEGEDFFFKPVRREGGIA